METTITVTRATRQRLAALQNVMRLEKGGRAVTADEAINRALDRSAELAAYIKQNYPVPAQEDPDA